ncbi:hypothetical protein BHE74_00032845 [Ensete ventricosum]|nr:hypothetical protein BHE74_00032845 [Ensete ventricosum]
MGVAICLSIDQGKLLGEHRVVEASDRKGRGSDDESRGAQLPKSLTSIRMEWTRRSATMSHRRIYRLRRKGCRCEATDSSAMSLATSWYRRGGTSMESSIPCSRGERALVVKGVKEMENAKAYFKYQDKAKGKRPMNFIRQVSMGFSSR